MHLIWRDLRAHWTIPADLAAPFQTERGTTRGRAGLICQSPGQRGAWFLGAVDTYVDQAVLGAQIAEEERQRGQLRTFAEQRPSRTPSDGQ